MTSTQAMAQAEIAARAAGVYRADNAGAIRNSFPTEAETPVDKIIRLAGGASTDLAIQGGDDTNQAPTTGLMQTTAAALIPGMVVSHPQVANGKPFQVVNHAHRGTHVEIIGKHPANGRGVLTRLPPGANLMVHSLVNQSIGDTSQQPKNPSISNGVLPGNQEWSGPAMGGSTI
jgi:hypothetical protein